MKTYKQGGYIMRKNFGAKPLSYPQPVLIVAAYDENGNVDPAKAAPITFDPFNNTCLRLGEKVGNAFSDGKRIKLLPQGYSGQR